MFNLLTLELEVESATQALVNWQLTYYLGLLLRIEARECHLNCQHRLRRMVQREKLNGKD